MQAGVVEKSGSWFSYDGTRIGQGRENAKQYLKEHPDTASAIEQAIRANAGLVADAMLVTAPADGEADAAPAAKEE
jgi:recombination protein RecA